MTWCIEAMVSDETLYDEAKAEAGEFFPVEVVDRLLAGESPIRVYRTYRGMTRKQLAEAAESGRWRWAGRPKASS